MNMAIDTTTAATELLKEVSWIDWFWTRNLVHLLFRYLTECICWYRYIPLQQSRWILLLSKYQWVNILSITWRQPKLYGTAKQSTQWSAIIK
jgi:hypothetical protein